ncbi:unnamed protein product [Arctogadus glacialis]
MGGLPVVLLLCSFHAFTAVVQAQQTEAPGTSVIPLLPPNCSEQKYPCTRMYSVQRPMKKCVGSMCFYSLPRIYLINKEICTRILCDDDEFLQAERCREQAGWPKRLQRSTNQKRCQDHRGNLKTWANKP